MRRLLLAEFARVRSRRLTLVALILIVLALAGLQFAVIPSVKPLTQEEVAQAQVQYQAAQQDYEQNKAQYEAGEQECVDAGNPPESCSQEPKLENYEARTPTTYRAVAQILVTVSVLLTGLAFLFLGASLIGAEYSTGALANWLSFIPERGKVFASKLLAVVVVSALGSAVASAITIGVAALLTRSAGAAVDQVGKVVQMGARGVVIGAICAVLGFCLALVTRHTIAASGAVLGYLLVAFVVKGLSTVVPGFAKLLPWLPENNMLAFLDHGYHYTTYENIVTADGVEQREVEHLISFAHSAGYFSVLVVVVVGAALVIFRRRDVN